MGGRRLQHLLAGAFDHYAARASRRVAGLTNDEYFWEPVAGCWTVRRAQDGSFTHDWAWPAPDPPPVTTIAWRLVHICSFLQEHALRPVAFERGVAAWAQPSVVPGSAGDALAALDVAVGAWRRDLTSVDDARLWEPMGSEAGRFADEPVASFIEHIHDEFVHHSAEVALLLDLYRAGGA